MSKERRAVEWYKDCIRQKQRQAVTLAINVDLKAMDNADSQTLLKTIQQLDSVVATLEQAHHMVGIASGEQLMEDLGHSMAPMDFRGSPAPIASQMAEAASRDALAFFG